MAKNDYREAGRTGARRLGQDDEQGDAGEQRGTATVTLLGNTLPVPSWTLTGIGILVLVGMVAVIARHLGLDAESFNWSAETRRRIEFANQEYGRHLWEEPVQTYAAMDGVFTIKAYADHCIAIQRKVGASYKVRLIPDLAMEPDLSTSRSDDDGVLASWATRALDTVVPGLKAQGRCSAPHTGRFNTWNDRLDNCRVRVWRQWPDGCTHFQMMNTCSGTWDTNADGSPRVTWTACRH
jgi:hypothetical protein